MTFVEEQIKQAQVSEKRNFLREYGFVLLVLFLVALAVMNTITMFQNHRLIVQTTYLLDKAEAADSQKVESLRIRYKMLDKLDILDSGINKVIINQKDGQIRGMNYRDSNRSAFQQIQAILDKKLK